MIFQFVNKGFPGTLLLIPGWAADRRIFDPLDLDFNYLIPHEFSVSDFENALLNTLKGESFSKISIFGWSMGGFLAADFASQYPELVKEIILVGMRKKYDKNNIEKIKEYITTNKNAYLYKFYRECGVAENEWATSLFKHYIKDMPTEQLMGGLDYLTTAELDAKKLKYTKIKFIHGENDRIAPIEDILSLKPEFPQAEFVLLKGAGHLPFLRKDFKQVFHE